MRNSESITCLWGQRLTHDGQQCEKSMIGCLKKCVHKPEPQPQNWQFGQKKGEKYDPVRV